jgi:methylated-DNA-[protein]-cysteine S-methyltransferase
LPGTDFKRGLVSTGFIQGDIPVATTAQKTTRKRASSKTTKEAAGSRTAPELASHRQEQCCAFTTELGAIGLAWRGTVVTRISIGHISEAAALAALSSREAEPTQTPPEFIQELVQRLQSYAAGDRTVTFGDVPLELSHLSPFQKKVVDRCRRIAAGGTRTYGELADLAGYPGAARAVGSVMSRNRFPIVIPCHRVVGSAGSLGGFSAPQGISLKERMLTLEGASLKSKSRTRKAK